MILVDTSVWVDHQRGSAPHLTDLLNNDLVLTHPFVVGELACGALPNRAATLSLFRNLQQCNVAAEEEVLLFLEMHTIYGRGIGYIDAHLLTSAAIAGFRLWTRDKRLAKIAMTLQINYPDQP
jgi:predicted nucleic acid-binding protein